MRRGGHPSKRQLRGLDGGNVRHRQGNACNRRDQLFAEGGRTSEDIGEPPQDAGRYVLREIASKSEASGAEEEITVDRHRVECGDGHPGYCKVVNGAPFRGQIVGFHPRHDYDYRLRVERFGMFPDGTAGSPEVPVYGYRWLETLESKLRD